MAYDANKISEVILAFHSETDSGALLSTILTKLMELTNSDAGTIYTVKDDKLHFSIVKNITLGIFETGEVSKLPPMKIDKEKIDNISVYTAVNNKMVIIDDVYEDERFNFDGPKNYDAIIGYRTKSLWTIPLITEWKHPKEVIGVIQLINKTCRKTGDIISYSSEDNPPIISAISKIAANTLSNSIYVKDIRKFFSSIVGVLSKALDERSKYNSEHTKNVERLVKVFAKHINAKYGQDHPLYFNDNRLEQLSLAAFLHDIGKILTPISILDKATRLGDKINHIHNRFQIKLLQLEISFLKNEITQLQYEKEVLQCKKDIKLIGELDIKPILSDNDIKQVNRLKLITYNDKKSNKVPILTAKEVESLNIIQGTLTEEEREIMKKHVLHSTNMINEISIWKYFSDVPKLVSDHHELLDGTGYPQNLKGEEITAETRILTICDIFESITSRDRPYKKATSIEDALNILKKMSKEGKLDDNLLNIFIESKTWESIF